MNDEIFALLDRAKHEHFDVTITTGTATFRGRVLDVDKSAVTLLVGRSREHINAGDIRNVATH